MRFPQSGRSPCIHRHRGVALFVALLVLVVLGLASVALFRSAETTTLVSGHIASKQAAVAAVDRGIEHAVGALWGAGASLADKTVHDPARNYYACIRAATDGCLGSGSSVPEVPAALATPAQFAAAGLNASLVADDAAGHASVYVIERVCLGVGPALASHCNMPATAPLGSGGTEPAGQIASPPDAYYRVTVKVTGPRNTVAYAQALLRPPSGTGRERRVAWRLLATH